jgi:hypothetical protein
LSSRRLACLAVFVALVGCSPAPSSAPTSNDASASGTAGHSPTDARLAGWRSDLDQLLPGMEAIHPDPFHSTPRPALQAAVDELRAEVAGLSDDEVMVGVLRVVALVSADGRDGHTGAFIWGEDSAYPVHSLPLRLWFFADGLYVVDALPPYDDLVGSRVDSIAGRNVADAQAAIEPLVPRDNDETVILLTPRYLLIPEVLHGLRIIDEVGSVELGLTNAAGARVMQAVEPIPMAEYNAWAGPYGLHLPDDPDVPYLSRTQEVLWWTRLQGTSDLYVQYNRVEDLASTLLDRLRAAAASDEVDRIIVDIRHNFGGQTFAYPPLLRVLTSFGVRSKPLFVISGRNTFSAACLFAAEVDRETGALFVGEPMGGSPNLYGNARSLVLAYSGLAITVATEYFIRSTPDDERLTIEPDLLVPLTSTDYFAHRDPSLAAIAAAH